MKLTRFIEDPRRDAAAIVFLLGLLVCGVAPVLIDHYCRSSFALPALLAGPLLVAASFVVRRSGRGVTAFAILAFLASFLAVGFVALLFSSPEHCPLILG